MAARKKATRRKPVLTEEGKKTKVAVQVTFCLKGMIKRSRMECIMVSVLLARMRDEQLYLSMKHPDIEDYAEKHLQLGRSSLHNYLQIHDWVAEFHKEWFKPKPGMFIPDLSDVSDLMWIDEELKKKNLDPARRTALETLQKKGVEGTLRRTELRQLRRRKGKGDDVLKPLLSSFRILRNRCAKLATVPAEVIKYLDSAIEVLKNEKTLQIAGMNFLEIPKKVPTAPKLFVAKC